ncbi:hypothetical protein H7F50_15765 [Novosphingobium flavum]|uniref:DUF5818 domain-containing protein n=1 Tax=Novosphingobium aerophilum TaxID=2839843 RepID=UPI0016399D48|nr:DUF5818 domain-containing protein [Novosphingobium aerophilum]MBC2663205.1 hypothetical protein [Novosphingobium aerophilum]
MPMGTRHTVTGILHWDDRQGLYRLDVATGGYWFAHLPRRARHLPGRKVTVEGIRSGFNLLTVRTIIAIDGVKVKPPWFVRLRRFLARRPA